MRVTAGMVMRWAVEVAVACVAVWCARAVPIQHSRVIHQPSPVANPTVLSADMVQTVAVITRLSTPGIVEKVEMDTKRIGCSPILVITTKGFDGDIRKDYIVLDGLVLEPMAEDRVMRCVKPTPGAGDSY